MIKPVESFLKKNEKLIYVDKPHIINLISEILILVVLGYGIYAIIPNEFLFLLKRKMGDFYFFFLIASYCLIWIGLITLFTVHFITLRYVITNTRVFKKYGLIANYTEAYQYSKIESIDVSQGWIDRLFNTYSLVVSGVGGDESKTFGSLENADIFYEKLQDATDSTMNETTVGNEDDLESLYQTVENVTTTDLDTTQKIRKAGELLIEIANDLEKGKKQ